MTIAGAQNAIRQAVVGNITRRAAALPPADSATDDLFSVDDGAVILTGFVGYVTSALPAASIDFDIDLDPDDGGSDVALASTLVCDSDPIGTYYTLNTTAGGALVATLDVAYNAILATPIVLDPGDIKLSTSGGGAIGTTARVRWAAMWLELDAGASLTAV
jgi:hypothetical protein